MVTLVFFLKLTSPNLATNDIKMKQVLDLQKVGICVHLDTYVSKYIIRQFYRQFPMFRYVLFWIRNMRFFIVFINCAIEYSYLTRYEYMQSKN